jgi:V/A-type H+-transporting ATPase subunit A
VSNNSSSPESAPSLAPVIGVQESLVTIDVSQVPVMKNEVGYILVGKERLKAEVLRIQGDVADM